MPIKKHVQEYSAEFRIQAVQLDLTSGKPRQTVASELGVGFSTLTKWIRQQHSSSDATLLRSASSGITTQQTLEQEVRRLKRENEILRLLAPDSSTFLILTMHLTGRIASGLGAQEGEILKAATRFFIKESQ